MDELAASITAGQTAVAAKIAVTQGTTALATSTGTYDFGSVVADNMAGNFVGSAITFTITNGGGTASTLIVSGVTLSGTNAADFVLPTFTGTTLAYNATTTFTLTFDPAVAGSKTATITIASSDPTTPSYVFGITGSGQAFRLPTVAVPSTTGYSMGYIGIPTGPAAHPHTIAISAFEIGTYEVTYSAWSTVKTWALAHGYSFAHPGQMGDGRPAATGQEPVTLINWRDAIAWCNAASELAGLTPAYFVDQAHTTPYKDSSGTAGVADASNFDTNTNLCVDWTTHGYRLPTDAEWEYAAKRNGGTVTFGDRASGDSTTTGTTPWIRSFPPEELSI
jgi:hypothetical protein